MDNGGQRSCPDRLVAYAYAYAYAYIFTDPGATKKATVARRRAQTTLGLAQWRKLQCSWPILQFCA